MKKSLAGMNLEEIRKETAALGLPAFRAAQIYRWISKGAYIEEMTDLPLELRENLQKEYASFALSTEKIYDEQKSCSKKYLYLANDDIIIESVKLVYNHGSAVCVSSQAGCMRNCSFCVSSENGLIRNLSAEEMLSQVLLIMRHTGGEVPNVVLMGSGEPLDNYSEVKKFIGLLCDKDGIGLSMRKITLSTCGIVPGILQMADDGMFVNLSVSLHSPVSTLRAELMPVEKVYPLTDVIGAAQEFRRRSKRRITYEYCVIEGCNDTDACADALLRLLEGSDALVNLIDVNAGRIKKTNSRDAAENFSLKLKERKISHTIRRRLGSSINAACGQLSGGYRR